MILLTNSNVFLCKNCIAVRKNYFCSNAQQGFASYCGSRNYVHTTKSRTRVIYSLKELAHFWSKQLRNFLHVQYTNTVLCLTVATVKRLL
jgi:hypothetical protein